MSQQALQTLKFMFQDRPEVIRLFDLRELDLSGREDEAWLKEQSKQELFITPVNFYATGRTGAGKTTLAITLIDPEKKLANTIKEVFPSTGKTDCTWMVVFFQMRSNLRYFDLPGAGGCSDIYENINRAALMIPQIKDEDEELKLVDQFDLWNCSDYPTTKKVDKRKIGVKEWQSQENQEFAKPDIVLYVVAPNKQFVREDKKYLRALLKQQKKLSNHNKVIFALNIHYNDDGTRITTTESVEDAREKITEIFQEFYPHQSLPIVEVDCKRGAGINKVTELMYQILPDNKIGNMRQVLPDKLKDFARKERSRRYRQALVYIASRLAIRKVDEKQGEQDLLNEVYMAVADYGIQVFQQEDARVKAATELNDAIDQLAQDAKISREKAEKILVDRIVMNEKEVEKSDYVPDFQDVEVEQQVVDYVESQESRRELVDGGRSPGRIAAGTAVGGLAGLGGFTAGLMGLAAAGATVATGGLAAPLAAAVLGGAGIGGAIGSKKQKKEVTVTEDVIKPIVKTITKTQKQFMGMKEVKKTVMEKVPEVMQEEKVVGKKYLQGGYPVVENLLAIGLGIENTHGSENLPTDFNEIVEAGRKEAQAILLPYQEQINSFAVNNNEQKIIEISGHILYQI